MWSNKVGPVVLCAVAYVATAYRKKSENAASIGPDFSEAVTKMKEVDRYSPQEPTDSFTVFETDGGSITHVVTPDPKACSLETLKKALKECPERGKICIALYKINYPRAIGSSTLKARSILMYGQDKEVMGKALGGTFKATKVSMAFVNFVWGGLKKKMQEMQVSPTLSLELADGFSIDAVADATAMWSNIKSSVGRVEGTEGAAFEKHVENMIAKTAGAVVAPAVSSPTQADKPTSGSEGQPSVPVPQAPVSAPVAVDMNKIIKEVEGKVSKSIEDTARKIAREEVGMAVRKLGTDIGEATRGVGKTWLDKSRGVTK